LAYCIEPQLTLSLPGAVVVVRDVGDRDSALIDRRAGVLNHFRLLKK